MTLLYFASSLTCRCNPPFFFLVVDVSPQLPSPVDLHRFQRAGRRAQGTAELRVNILMGRGGHGPAGPAAHKTRNIQDNVHLKPCRCKRTSNRSQLLQASDALPVTAPANLQSSATRRSHRYCCCCCAAPAAAAAAALPLMLLLLLLLLLPRVCKGAQSHL
jgi:hypothetical protein